MPLTMRPWSVNCYALSKVWFRCGSVDLREGDISAINSTVKSWLYSDLYEKPNEVVMCRPPTYGGLGVYSVRFKAQAMLIKTFLETAANPNFRHSLLHSVMFRFHVLGDDSVPDPGYLPYYPPSFFVTIKQVHEESDLDVATMTTGQWVQALTEGGLTMEGAGSKQYKLCKAEIASPTTDWSLSWKLCRLPGLGSELSTFNFKLLHGLLVTKLRQNHFKSSISPLCPLCSKSNEDLHHALITCEFNNGVGQLLLSTVHSFIPTISGPALLRLELSELQEDQELPITLFTSSILLAIWEKRFRKCKFDLYEIRATLEARCLLLRKTRLDKNVPILQTLLSKFQ